MKSQTYPENPSDSRSVSGLIDSICDRFEAAWRTGKKPQIEEFLQEARDVPRTQLLQAMLAVDIQYRQKAGEDLNEEDYRRRFPENLETIHAIFVQRDTTTSFPAEVDRPIPQVLGDYELLERVGSGGMGVVYKARHRRLNRLVALKVLRSEFIESPEAARRFAREMEAGGRIIHPNLVMVTDAREENGVPLLVMEYVDGEDLGQVLRRQGRLPVKDACEITRQTAIALQHAHENGLVHRDIKPSNLMWTTDGTVKVLDLGLARIQDDLVAITATGQTLGTPDYMAPEQICAESQIDIRADLYSLGCTLYHLLVGQPPFSGSSYSSHLSKLQAHVEAPFPSVRQTHLEIPEQLQAIIERLTAKNPDERFGAPQDLVHAVTPFAEA
jgi:serine/threonine protein kinase